MAWSSPLTASANAILTAASWNATVRDNLNETAVAKATAAGRIYVSTGANSLAERTINMSSVATSETTTSTSHVNLATSGPAVTCTTGTSALVCLSCRLENNTSGQRAFMAYLVSGASSISETDDLAVGYEDTAGSGMLSASHVHVINTGLNAGSNTFTCRYRVSGGTGTFAARRLTVIGF